ncbi:hypothetical protein [Amycolatopsis sp. FDAARGOS 1241]|uniref:hypothetical protein n=1 Tax=Amycolatopsis sp. FDAARGOS 1241 TaxID=2778070 RepID=UPI001951F0BB|nr:hypothetical protein [Amycolatopsis sp. FDAARGOS 1241]QRP46949.1 hypothetical protein I6J71_02545 [Amycolatopsis sp. FDAARGOS 1241]
MPREEPRPRDERAEQARRRRRVDEVFGDVLPETTSDERGLTGDTPDSWYLENRPPHHDR